MSEQCDIAVIGGGPVGAALALALQNSGLNITVLESRTSNDTHTDPRALALSYGSRLLLEKLNVWQNLTQVSAIQTIHISQKNSFGRTQLKAQELNVPDLGYVLPYANLQARLQLALTQCNANLLQGATVNSLTPNADGADICFMQGDKEHTLQAQLVVVADGGKLLESTHPPILHDYGQSALIAHVSCSQPKSNTAFERFTAQGPLALLPYQNGYELVWTAPHAQLASMLQWDDATLLTQLHTQFGDRVGNFLSVGSRSTFPLRLKRAPAITLPHTVLIGNAAQTLHPVAGQGFNMGLRDAWELAQLILDDADYALGNEHMLAKYRLSRNTDRNAGIHFTDGLVRLFSNEIPLLNTARAASLSLLDCLPGMKKFVAKRMMFGVNG
jgi:2-octaprenyl-6-methoxyphenol hydroxylase